MVGRWRYIDPSGTLQGPFPARNMLEWYRKGMLHDMGLMVCGAVSQRPWAPGICYKQPTPPSCFRIRVVMRLICREDVARELGRLAASYSFSAPDHQQPTLTDVTAESY